MSGSAGMSGRPRGRVLTVALATLIISALVAAPVVVAAAEVPYRGEVDRYREEGFGYIAPFLPYTEYRAVSATYNEEGLGHLPAYRPYTTYRAVGGTYNEEGFGLVR